MSDDGTNQFPGPDPAPPADGSRTPPPTGAALAPPRQLVRDPYTRLGGVASGLAHYTGLDVSLVRLAFVLLTFTSGIGLVVYLVAWLVVPRAQYWPPVGEANPARSITTRELAIGLLLLGLLIILFANGGATARVIVPVLLIGGGVWLLRQPTALSSPAAAGVGGLTGADGTWAPPAPGDLRPEATPADPTVPLAADPAGPFATVDAPQPTDTVLDDPFGATPPPIPPSATGDGPAPGTPVPRRRRRWGRFVFALVLLFVIIPLILIAVVGTLLVTSGIDIDPDFSATYQPTELVDLGPIEHDTGEIVLDLTALDPDLFDVDGVETPIPVEVDLAFGEIRVIVPDDLDVTVQAEAGVGDLQVFGASNDGVDPEITRLAEDADVELDLRVGAGQVIVQQG